MSALTDFFLNTKPSIVELECLEITHPNFSLNYYLVRNAINGVAVTHDVASGGGTFTYSWTPMKIRTLNASTDLDQDIEITLGDVGEIIAKELEAVSNANGFQSKPTVKYRTYRSDDLSTPMFGPVVLRIDTITLTREGALFNAKAASYNLVRTGEVYETIRFPMLEPLA